MSLFEAINNRDTEEIKRLIRLNPNCVNEKDEKGNTPLHFASMNGNKEIVKILIQAGGADSINEKNIFGYTPLHISSGFNRKEIAEILLYNGADYSIKDSEGKDGLQYFFLKGNRDELIEKCCTFDIKDPGSD
jgi:ankyrin repeat protein